jgi:hypothetical protein
MAHPAWLRIAGDGVTTAALLLLICRPLTMPLLVALLVLLPPRRSSPAGEAGSNDMAGRRDRSAPPK